MTRHLIPPVFHLHGHEMKHLGIQGKKFEQGSQQAHSEMVRTLVTTNILQLLVASLSRGT